MNASQLIRQIKALCQDNGRDPKDVTINYRHCNNSEVFAVGRFGKKTLLHLMPPVQLHGPALTGRQLISAIERNCKYTDVRPCEIDAQFRLFDLGSSYPINSVEEDLFDSETNNILESICLLTSDN